MQLVLVGTLHWCFVDLCSLLLPAVGSQDLAVAAVVYHFYLVLGMNCWFPAGRSLMMHWFPVDQLHWMVVGFDLMSAGNLSLCPVDTAVGSWPTFVDTALGYNFHIVSNHTVSTVASCLQYYCWWSTDSVTVK